MSLLTTLNDDIKIAMKVKDKKTLAVLHMSKIAIQNDQIKTGRESNGEGELVVSSRKMKQRKDSPSESEKVGRDDLAEKVKVEIATIEKYMPQQLAEGEIRQLAQEVTTQTGATPPKDFGKVMGAMMLKVKGKVDGNQANATVKELLQEN